MALQNCLHVCLDYRDKQNTNVPSKSILGQFKTNMLNTRYTRRDSTFILKKVILVRRSTVDLRSCSLSGLLAGKLFCSQTEKEITVSHKT